MTKLQVVNDKQEEKLKDTRHLIFCLENGCEVCFPDGGVKYESDADTDDSDESDDTDDSDISESDKTDDDDQEIKIE